MPPPAHRDKESPIVVADRALGKLHCRAPRCWVRALTMFDSLGLACSAAQVAHDDSDTADSEGEASDAPETDVLDTEIAVCEIHCTQKR